MGMYPTCTPFMATFGILRYVQPAYKNFTSHTQYIDKARRYSIYDYNLHFVIHKASLQKKLLHALSMQMKPACTPFMVIVGISKYIRSNYNKFASRIMLTKQTCTLLMAITRILEYIRHDYKNSASYEKYVDEACKYSIYGHKPHFKVHMTRLQKLSSCTKYGCSPYVLCLWL